MGYEIVEYPEGSYAFATDVIDFLARSYAFATAQDEESRTVSLSQSDWWHPLSWGLPDMQEVRTDWDAVRRKKSEYAQHLIQNFRAGMVRRRSVHLLREDLRKWARDTKYHEERWRQKRQQAQKKTMANISAAEATYEKAIDVAEFTRDASAATVLTGASLMSGGAALGFLTTGSALKATAKYQDTAHLGQGRRIAGATLEFTMSFVVGVIPGPSKELSRGENISLVLTKELVETQGEAATALLEGRSVVKAVATRPVAQGVDQACKRIFRVNGIGQAVSRLSLGSAVRIVGAGACLVAGNQARATMVDEEKDQSLTAGAGTANGNRDDVGFGDERLVDWAIQGPDRCHVLQ